MIQMMQIDLYLLMVVIICLYSPSLTTVATTRIRITKSSQAIYDTSPKLRIQGLGSFDVYTNYVTNLRYTTETSSSKVEAISKFVDERYEVVNDNEGLTLKLKGNQK